MRLSQIDSELNRALARADATIFSDPLGRDGYAGQPQVFCAMFDGFNSHLRLTRKHCDPRLVRFLSKTRALRNGYRAHVIPLEGPSCSILHSSACAGGSSGAARLFASRSRAWTCARAAFITIHRTGMARPAKSYWSLGATITRASSSLRTFRRGIDAD
jgi:hypothetical protein